MATITANTITNWTAVKSSSSKAARRVATLMQISWNSRENRWGLDGGSRQHMMECAERAHAVRNPDVRRALGLPDHAVAVQEHYRTLRVREELRARAAYWAAVRVAKPGWHVVRTVTTSDGDVRSAVCIDGKTRCHFEIHAPGGDWRLVAHPRGRAVVIPR